MNLRELWFKLTHSKKYWHFLEYLPEVELRLTPENTRQIFFQNNFITTARPLSELTSLCQDQQVFLVGTGPSIKEQDLTYLKQYPRIFLNGAITLSTSHAIQPSAYLVTDKGFIKRHTDFVRLIPAATPCIFTLGVVRQILTIQADFFQTHPLYLIEKATKPYAQAALSVAELDRSAFIVRDGLAYSLDLQQGFAEAGTVMYVAAQLALYLQAKGIILAGFDLGNADQPRFYETQHNQDKSGLLKALEKRIIPSFELLAEQCQARHIALSNASHLSNMPYEIIEFNPILMPADSPQRQNY